MRTTCHAKTRLNAPHQPTSEPTLRISLRLSAICSASADASYAPHQPTSEPRRNCHAVFEVSPQHLGPPKGGLINAFRPT
jgi:hypothetical protein